MGPVVPGAGDPDTVACGGGSRPREVEVVRLGTEGLRVRRDESEKRFGAGQRPVEHGRLVVGADDGLDLVADRAVQT